MTFQLHTLGNSLETDYYPIVSHTLKLARGYVRTMDIKTTPQEAA